MPTQKIQREVDRVLLRQGREEESSHMDLLVWEGAGHAHCISRPRTWRQMRMVMKRQEQIIFREDQQAADTKKST